VRGGEDLVEQPEIARDGIRAGAGQAALQLVLSITADPQWAMLLLIACTAVGLGSLPSCSQFSPPVGIAVEGPGYQVSYQFAK
jgi:hypothetical protein